MNTPLATILAILVTGFYSSYSQAQTTPLSSVQNEMNELLTAEENLEQSIEILIQPQKLSFSDYSEVHEKLIHDAKEVLGNMKIAFQLIQTTASNRLSAILSELESFRLRAETGDAVSIKLYELEKVKYRNDIDQLNNELNAIYSKALTDVIVLKTRLTIPVTLRLKNKARAGVANTIFENCKTGGTAYSIVSEYVKWVKQTEPLNREHTLYQGVVLEPISLRSTDCKLKKVLDSLATKQIIGHHLPLADVSSAAPQK